MKKSFELEDSFRRLSYIPRSDYQKRKTYEKIIQQQKSKNVLNDFISHMKGTILSITTVLLCTIFLYIQVTAIGQQSSVKTADYFATGEVIGVYLTRSDTDHYFSLNNNVTRKGVSFIDNEAWLKTISSALKGKVAAAKFLNGAVTYDMLIIFDGRESTKYKMRISGNEVYINRMKETQLYKIDPVNASKIIDTVQEMERQFLK